MSTKLTKQGEKPNATENSDGKSEPTRESCQSPAVSVPQNQAAGRLDINVMTAQEASDLLARLQDILFLWLGSDNKIIGNYVMTAFPIPAGVDVSKMVMTRKATGGHDISYKVFCVNGRPVTE